MTVELFGLAADSVRNNRAHKVKAVTSNTNSFYVQFYDLIGFSFKKIIMPQLATLVFTVNDEQGKVYGRRFLPISAMRPGYRFISLKSESNQPLNMNALFVHISIKDYVPEYFEDFANALVDPINYVQSQAKKEEMLQVLCDEQDYTSYVKEVDSAVVKKKASAQISLATVSESSVVLDAQQSSEDLASMTPLQIALRDQQALKQLRKTVAPTLSEHLLRINSEDDDLEVEWKSKLGKLLKEIDGNELD